MLRPLVSICSHRHINVLDLAALSKKMAGSKQRLNFRDRNHELTLIYSTGLFTSLQKLSSVLDRHSKNKHFKNSATEDSELIERWIRVKDELTKRPLISTLLPPLAIQVRNQFNE